MIGRRSGRPAVARVQNSISLNLAASRDPGLLRLVGHVGLDLPRRPQPPRAAGPAPGTDPASSITARLDGARVNSRPFDASSKAASSFVLPVPGGPWMRRSSCRGPAAGAGPGRRPRPTRTASEIQSAVFSGRVHRVSRVVAW